MNDQAGLLGHDPGLDTMRRAQPQGGNDEHNDEHEPAHCTFTSTYAVASTLPGVARLPGKVPRVAVMVCE